MGSPVSLSTAQFRELIAQKKILICAGAGGVGKTTTAAVVALAAAHLGRRTLVVTIDPAKRLAAALGICNLGHQEQRILTTDPNVELFAMMLDQKQAFDEILAAATANLSLRKRIESNKIYRQISTRLTGSHEYAAIMKLGMLNETGNYDLIVVDTPPTAHALDLLSAPQKVAEAVDSPALEWIAKPLSRSGSSKLGWFGRGSSFFLKRVAKFVGSAFLDDMASFLGESGEVLTAFRDSARKVDLLLKDDSVGYLVVTAPTFAAVDEAILFYQKLKHDHYPFAAFVANRVHPEYRADMSNDDLKQLVSNIAQGASQADVQMTVDALNRCQNEMAILAESDRVKLGRLVQKAPGNLLVELPILDRDVHDIDGLMNLGAFLLSDATPA